MPIWKTKYGWRTRVEVNGQRIYGPTFRYKSEARAWCEAEKQRRKARAEQPATSELLYLAESYLDHVQLNFGRRTYYEKRGALERLITQVGNVNPREVSPAQIMELLAARARERSNNAANKDRKNIKAFYRWLQDFHGIMHDPTGPVRPLPHTKKARRLIPIQDIFRVIMVAPMPEKALIACYWHTGARRGEILRLIWAEDVNLEERWIRLGTRKTRDGSMVYERLWINDDLLGLLKQLWRMRDPSSPYLFPDYYQPDKRGNNWKGEQRAHRLLVGSKDPRTGELRGGLCEKAGVEPFGYHDIRHTVAKYLNDVQKVGLKKVQQVLRHRRQTTTEIYVEGNYTDVRPAMELLTQDSVRKSSQKSSQNEKTGLGDNA